MLVQTLNDVPVTTQECKYLIRAYKAAKGKKCKKHFVAWLEGFATLYKSQQITDVLVTQKYQKVFDCVAEKTELLAGDKKKDAPCFNRARILAVAIFTQAAGFLLKMAKKINLQRIWEEKIGTLVLA